MTLWPITQNFFGLIYAAIDILSKVLTQIMPLGAKITLKKVL